MSAQGGSGLTMASLKSEAASFGKKHLPILATEKSNLAAGCRRFMSRSRERTVLCVRVCVCASHINLCELRLDCTANQSQSDNDDHHRRLSFARPLTKFETKTISFSAACVIHFFSFSTEQRDRRRKNNNNNKEFIYLV